MNTTRVWLFGLGLAILAAACSSPQTSGNPGTGGNGSAGTTGAGGSTSCAAAQTVCGSQCVDTTSDSNNCGACGLPCNGGRICQNSQCQCQAGLLDCNGSCVASDATHCGGCSTVCQTNQVCSNSSCGSSCTGTQVLCGTACVDTTASATNCGSCGHACGSNQQCTNGACVDNGTTGVAGTNGSGGTTGAAGTSGSAGASGSAGRSGGTAGASGSVGSGGRGGTTGSAGTTGSGGAAGTTAAAPKVITSSPSGYWNISGTLTTVTSGTATVTVNDGTTMKTFEGFGGAFNEMGWNFLSMLSATDRDHAMQLLFDATNGAHFGIGRIPIGASDYALQRYTNDETANDTSLTNFAITEDMKYLIPYVKAAMAVNGSIRFWASPWTPPTWMKTNSGTVNGTSCAKVGSTLFDGGCMQDIAANLTALAQYFVSWVKAYSAQGITIETVAPQNEPSYAQGYPSTLWDPALYTKFVGQYMGPAFSTAGLSTKIMLGTMSNGDNGTQSKDLMVVTNAMGNATAKGLFKVIGLQWGMLDLYKGTPSMFDMYNLPVWATEHKCGNYPWNPSGYPAYVEPAPNNQAYGVESWGYIRDAIKAGVTAYNAWNMVLDTVGKGNDMTRQWSQDSLLAVNTSSKTLIVTPAYYVFRHVSQYVKAGAKVVATSGGDAIAFKNTDGSVVAAMYNSGGAATYIVQIKSQKLQFSMPGTGWATVVVP